MAVLIFISPVLTELLMGSVQLSKIWLLVPMMGVYGFAALLIREVVRRRRRGWGMILLLGIAYAIAEECVILQTSLTPQVFPPAFTANFGWAWGVQWIYLTALVWYESVFAIVLPIYLTEILFPKQRDEPWLSQRGLVIAAVIFLLSSIGVWRLWTTVGVQHYGSSTYHVPPAFIGIALVVIAVLIGTVMLFFKQPLHPVQKSNRRAWSPWLVGLMAFGHGLAWFILIVLAYMPAVSLPGVSPLVPIGIGLAWVGLGLIVVSALSNTPDWQDRHRLAMIFGASLASMLGGVLVILSASTIDQIGKAAFDLIAIVLFILLVRRLRQPIHTPIRPIGGS